MRRQKRSGVSGCCAAFGVGVLVAVVFPPQVILGFVALALILLGCSRVRSR